MVERCCDINPFEEGTALGAVRSLTSFEEALSRLIYLAEHGRPCGIVRGPSGSGKSLLLETVTPELRRGGQECAVIDLRRTSAEEFAWQVACELGTAPLRPDRHQCWRLIEDVLQGRALAGRVTILVLDHLGEPGSDLLAELQRLLAITETSAGWCTVLGAARSESADMDRFVQEHSELRIELSPLDVDEAGKYLHQVVAMTGCRPFDDAAIQTLHESSRGVLRDLMTLARLALIARSAEEAPCVTGEIVRLVAAEVSPQPLRQKQDDQSAMAAVVN